MKKFLLSLGLVAMMLNLTNCAQYEEVNPSVDAKGDFELYASASRTANDGLNTVWSTGDALNVFHAVTDMTTYTSDGEFKLENAETGRFLGNLAATLDVEEEYDWYVSYPYDSHIATPASTNGGYLVVAAKAGANQTQNGNNSMAHLAGSNYPLAGVAKAVGAGVAPTVAMKNLTSVLEFEVTNSLDEAITVNQISFSAPVDIIGTYYINFVDMNNVVFTGSGTQYVANTANLEVKNGTAIAAGASAKFYLAVKPFTAAAGKSLTVVVNATSGTATGVHEKTIALTNAVEFKSGKIKTVKVDYNTAFEVSEEVVVATVGFESSEGFTASTTYNNTSVKYFGATGKQWGTICGTATTSDAITGSQSMQMRVYNSTGPKDPYVFMNYSLPSVSTISFKAKGSVTTNKLKLSYKTTGDWVDVETFTLTTSAKEFVHKFDTALENVSFKFTFVYPSSFTDKSKITIDNVVFKGINVTPETPSPVLSVNPSAVEFTAEGGSKTVACTIENEVEGVEVTATESVDWLTTSVSGKTVTITATENSASLERTATVTIAYEGAESKTVTVKQSEPVAAGAEIYTLLGNKLSNANSYTTSEKSITADDGSVWKIWGYYKNTTDIFQLGAKSKNYLLTPACTSDITTIEIACSGNYTVALWNPSTDKLITGMVAKPSKTTSDATGSIKFTLPAGYKQVKIISTRTEAGTGITTSNAACYIKKVVVTAQ